MLVSSIDQSTLAVVAHYFKMAASMEAINWTQENNEDKVIELWAEPPSLFNIESILVAGSGVDAVSGR
jgi:hypothetical protein